MNGYVTFVNDNPKYYELTKILVDSIIQFSKYNVEVFSINCDFNYNDKRVINKRIDLDVVNFETICYSKFTATLNCDFDVAVQLDADMIITKNTDKLFDESYRIKNMPLGSLHPKDPNNQKNVMDFLNVKTKTQPYVHATYLFNNNCKPFFEECIALSKTLMKKHIKPINYDETIYNTLLWYYESKDYLDCYDPYYKVFLDDKTKNRHGYINMNVNKYICHGLKDPVLAKQILNNLK